MLSVLIVIVKLIVVLYGLVKYFFNKIVYKIVRNLARNIYYKLVVRLYILYREFLNKTGLKKFKGGVVSVLFNQKLVHVVASVMTIAVVLSNFLIGPKITSASELAGKTIAGKIVGSEFGSLEEERLVEESVKQYEKNLSVQQNYLDNSSIIKNHPKVAKNIDIYEEEDTNAGVISPSKATAFIKKEASPVIKKIVKRTKSVEHIVSPGDTISTIAEEYGITVSTVLWENNLSSYSLIRPGDKLVILPVNGITHKVKRGETLGVIAKKYKVEEDAIAKANRITGSSIINIGQKLIIPNGKKVYTAPKTSSKYTGITAIKNLVRPANAKPAANKMNWPTVGNRITQYYSWRHKGLDIANKTGTPLFAADSGSIEFVGWSKGYGNNIVINHGAGKKTRYAHMSRFYVTKGQKVTKGETIGEMGSTGWSTGPHVHFEVIINNVKYNPLNYIR